MSRRIYLDLDGVLCDWVGGVRRLLPVPDPWPVGVKGVAKACGLTDEELGRAIRAAGDDWYDSLEPTPWAVALVEECRAMGQVVVLSAPFDSHSYSDKARWLGRHFPGLDFILTPRKELLARPGDILIDDYGRNVLLWGEAGGIGILSPQPWNSAHHLAADPFGAVHQALLALCALQPRACTGMSAGWCPVHGDCVCPNPDAERNDPSCPLHAPSSSHGELGGDLS